MAQTENNIRPIQCRWINTNKTDKFYIYSYEIEYSNKTKRTLQVRTNRSSVVIDNGEKNRQLVQKLKDLGVFEYDFPHQIVDLQTLVERNGELKTLELLKEEHNAQSSTDDSKVEPRQFLYKGFDDSGLFDKYTVEIHYSNGQKKEFVVNANKGSVSIFNDGNMRMQLISKITDIGAFDYNTPHTMINVGTLVVRNGELKTLEELQNTQLSNNYAKNLYVRLMELLQDGNLARRNSEFEDVLQKLSLHIAKLNNYNLRGNAIKFISEEMLIKTCGEGAFAANVPSDNNSIYLSPECIRNAIQQQKRKNEYDPRAFAVMLIDTISHEIKHNEQRQYNINTKNGNYEFGFQEWLNAMYDTVRITKKSGKLAYLENSNEAEAYEAGISGAKKFLQSIQREDDIEIDRPILKRNLPFQKFAASYGKINFHKENDGRVVNIAKYLDNAFNETSSRRKYVGAFKKEHPILAIQYDDEGKLKSVQQLAHQYFFRSLISEGKVLTLTDKDLACLEFAYCFVFADRLTRGDTEQLYKIYGKVQVDRLLASIKEKAIILKDEYSKSYQQGTEAIRDKNFNPAGTNQMNNVQKNTADIHAKYNASQRYFQQVIDKLNRANAFPSAPNGNFER